MTNEQPGRAAAPPSARPHPSLDDAPPPGPAAPAPAKPATAVDIVARVQSPEGLEMDITVRNVLWETPAGTALRAKAIEKALLAEGFKARPAPRLPAAATPGAATAGGGGGTGILNVNPDGSRTCTIHGPAKFVLPKDGKPGHWYCTEFTCKAREARSG